MMRWGRKLSELIAGLILATAMALPSAPGSAAEIQSLTEPLSLGIGRGQLLHLSRRAASVFVANPDIADIQVPSGTAVFVLGKKIGTTTLYAIDARDQTILKQEVAVTLDTEAVERILRQRYPDYRLPLTSAPGSLMVGGTVNTADDVTGVINTLAPMLGKSENLINNLKIRSPTQIQLRVRFSEVSRDIVQRLGINWSAIGQSGNFRSGLLNGRDYYNDTSNAYIKPDSNWGFLFGFVQGSLNIEAMIEALDGEGLVTTLAEPNLTAVSGQTASFLAGGEYPIPVAQQNNTTTIEFKPYGVSLAFTPTVLGNDRISLRVRPEVSALDWNNAVILGSTRVPAITARRVETTIELGSGQSFAIGGLLQSNITDSVSALPGLGQLPILGHLFSSKEFANNRSELVVIVTAHLVQPVDGKGLRTPTESLRPANDIEYYARSHLSEDPMTANGERLAGSVGFTY